MTPLAHRQKKFDAREHTVIHTWRELSGTRAIPRQKQYVSLLGPLTGSLWEEPNHVKREGLARLEQIHGIENVPERHAQNLKVVRDRYAGVIRLHQGNAIDALEDMARANDLRPAIVNLDLMAGPRTCLPTLVRAMCLLEGQRGPCLIVWNTIYHHRVRTQLNPKLFADVMSDRGLALACRDGRWREMRRRGEPCYRYKSTADTEMGTVLFWRDK